MLRKTLAIAAAALITSFAGGCTSEKSNAGDGASGSPAAGGAPAGSGGRASAGNTSAGAGGIGFVRGAVLEFVPGAGEVPYAIGENPYDIHGGGFLARSALGNTIAVGDDAGKICVSGTLDAVPDGNYGQYWGVEFGFNLNQAAPDEGAGGAGGEGGAAGAGGAAPDVAEPWLPGNVVGFSFVIEGSAIELVRFKSLPAGYDPALESSVFCKSVTATSGGVNDALFTQMTQYCWNAGPNLALPTAGGLSNLSWQLPADVGVVRSFDWCLSDLRPLLAP